MSCACHVIRAELYFNAILTIKFTPLPAAHVHTIKVFFAPLFPLLPFCIFHEPQFQVFYELSAAIRPSLVGLYWNSEEYIRKLIDDFQQRIKIDTHFSMPINPSLINRESTFRTSSFSARGRFVWNGAIKGRFATE